MAAHRRLQAALVWLLFGFFIHRSSSPARAMSFGPLIRPRAQKTSHEPSQEPSSEPPPVNGTRDTWGLMPDKLVSRGSASRIRTQQPRTGSTDGSNILFVIRDENGSLMPMFGSTTPVPPAAARSPSVAQHHNFAAPPIQVLRVSPGGNATAADGVIFDKQSYPDGYPFERIQAILKKKRDIYRDVFEEHLVANTLLTRLDSPTDQYLCSSSRTNEYPTLHHKSGQYIVNVPGFYQSVTFEHCDNVGVTCSNAITDSNSTLECEQVYSYYDVYVVPSNGRRDRFERLALEFPSCCKCKHVSK